MTVYLTNLMIFINDYYMIKGRNVLFKRGFELEVLDAFGNRCEGIRATGFKIIAHHLEGDGSATGARPLKLDETDCKFSKGLALWGKVQVQADSGGAEGKYMLTAELTGYAPSIPTFDLGVFEFKEHLQQREAQKMLLERKREQIQKHEEMQEERDGHVSTVKGLERQIEDLQAQLEHAETEQQEHEGQYAAFAREHPLDDLHREEQRLAQELEGGSDEEGGDGSASSSERPAKRQKRSKGGKGAARR